MHNEAQDRTRAFVDTNVIEEAGGRGVHGI